MKHSPKTDPSYIVVRIEPHPVHGLNANTRDVMRKVQALVARELGPSGRCASTTAKRPSYPPSAPHGMWDDIYESIDVDASPNAILTRKDIPAP